MGGAFSIAFELLKEDPCWDGYEQVVMKNKGGRQVPNCVPASKKIPDSKPKKKKVSKEQLLLKNLPPGRIQMTSQS